MLVCYKIMQLLLSTTLLLYISLKHLLYSFIFGKIHHFSQCFQGNRPNYMLCFLTDNSRQLHVEVNGTHLLEVSPQLGICRSNFISPCEWSSRCDGFLCSWGNRHRRDLTFSGSPFWSWAIHMHIYSGVLYSYM